LVYERLKDQAKKVSICLEKAVSFITCCAETHKGSFNSDLDTIKKAIVVLTSLTPASPVDEITIPALALGKACHQICQPYLEHAEAHSSGGGFPTVAATIDGITVSQRELGAAVEANLALIKSRPALPQDQQNAQAIRAALDKSKQASMGLIGLVQQAGSNSVDVDRMDSLYDELTRSCKEVVNLAPKLFSDL